MCSNVCLSKSRVYHRVSAPQQIPCFRQPVTVKSGVVVYIQETNNTLTGKTSYGSEISTATAMEYLRRPVLAIPVQIDEGRAAVLVDTLFKTCETSDCCVAFADSTSHGQDLRGGAHEAGSAQGAPTGAVTAGAINAVACLLDAVALSDRPRLRLLPLLTCAGWTPDLIACLPVTHVIVPQSTSPPSAFASLHTDGFAPAQGGDEAPMLGTSVAKGPDAHNRPQQQQQQPSPSPTDNPPLSSQQCASRSLDEESGASSAQSDVSRHHHPQPHGSVNPSDHQQQQQQRGPHQKQGGGLSEGRSDPAAPSCAPLREAVRSEAASSSSSSGLTGGAVLPSVLAAAAEALVGDLERRRPGHLPMWVRVTLPVGGAAASSGPGVAEQEVGDDGGGRGEGEGQEVRPCGAACGVPQQGQQQQQVADLDAVDSDQGRRGLHMRGQGPPPPPLPAGTLSSIADDSVAHPVGAVAETSGTSSRGGVGPRDGGGNGDGDEGGLPRPRELQPQPQPHYVTRLDGDPLAPDCRLSFRRVAVGGTFDRLHAGHELLLAATALVANGFVFVGVTADALLANKSYKELLQPYDKRVEEAVSYMRAVRPGLQIEAGPLSDPKAPTIAELDPSMEALVVSAETLPGAAAINAGRAARGFAPLAVITVPVIGVPPVVKRAGGAGSGGAVGRVALAAAAVGGKLSSSGLRAMEAAATRAAGAEEREAKSA